MAVRANQLTVAKIRAALAEGRRQRLHDGGNLVLHVRGPGTGYWVFRYNDGPHRREMGLGPYDPSNRDGLSLAAAREVAAEWRAVLRRGLDPIEERRRRERAERGVPTFREAAEAFLDTMLHQYRNAKHRQQWRSTLRTYAFPVLGDVPVDAVDTDHVLRVLQPIWTARTETAARVRQRLERILDYARVRGWREGENPARWRGHLALVLPPPSRLKGHGRHHPALDWREVPAFVAELVRWPSVSARALLFAILTAARTGEVLGARWGEIDMENRVWTIPDTRMKAGRGHRVPLSGPVLALLAELRPFADGPESPVFPGRRQRPLSQMALLMVLRRLNRDGRWRDPHSGRPVSVHGFRSAFRTWAGENTSHPFEVVEMALAHAVGDRTVQAYARGDLFDRRRQLMEDWATYCLSSAGAEASITASSSE